MATQNELTLKDIRPFWGRVAVVESPVDEAQRESGLLVPMKHDGHQTFRRGVVVHVDGEWSDPDRTNSANQLPPGTVVYFTGGHLIVDVYIVDMNEILAYEVHE